MYAMLSIIEITVLPFIVALSMPVNCRRAEAHTLHNTSPQKERRKGKKQEEKIFTIARNMSI